MYKAEHQPNTIITAMHSISFQRQNEQLTHRACGLATGTTRTWVQIIQELMVQVLQDTSSLEFQFFCCKNCLYYCTVYLWYFIFLL